MTKQRPSDPDRRNDARAEWAGEAIEKFKNACGMLREPNQDALGDLLTDLMHWCDRNDADFTLALEAARNHYEAEITS